MMLRPLLGRLVGLADDSRASSTAARSHTGPLIPTELAAAIKTDHGYSSESPEIDMLCAVMSEFNLKQQRDFVSFVTGAPNLPVGGFASLRPPLTVVRKDAESGAATLPSVMTCQNYLKLPAYPTKEVLHAKLVQAMTEGQGSFHLS
eukprot:m.131076 g.131076  ORF g.131076 m.131076 type:complete len:147 (+) comp16806_c1_seq2:5137-5577(+)